jgi:hypothetical protein
MSSNVVELFEGADSPQEDIEYYIPNSQTKYKFSWNLRNTKTFLFYSIAIFAISVFLMHISLVPLINLMNHFVHGTSSFLSSATLIQNGCKFPFL